jgi:hypothetical protein
VRHPSFVRESRGHSSYSFLVLLEHILSKDSFWTGGSRADTLALVRTPQFRDLDDSRTSHRSHALYQGTTLVGPLKSKKDLGFSP